MATEDRLRVAIVGVGPKGLYCFERLVARAVESGRPMRIDLFEPTGEPGAGAVYSARQPQWLRMNFADSLIDAWPEDSATVVPSHRRESFAEWLGGERPAEGDGYSPRALVGRYLGDCFAAIWASLPDNVEAHLHRARVEHLERRGAGWRLRAQGACPPAIEFDEVLLAIGHRSGAPASPWELGESGVRIAYPLGDAL